MSTRATWAAPRDLSSEIELIVSAEATQRLDLLDDLAGEVKRRLLSALSFGRGARACLACAPCTKPKFRAKKGWCAEISCARCRVLEECQRVGVVLVEESVAGFCAKDDRRFSGLVDTGFVADYNEALRVLVLRLAEDARAVAMSPPVVAEDAAPAARASRGEAATWATAAQRRASCLSFLVCCLFCGAASRPRRLVRVASPGFRREASARGRYRSMGPPGSVSVHCGRPYQTRPHKQLGCSRVFGNNSADGTARVSRTSCVRDSAHLFTALRRRRCGCAGNVWQG